MTSAVNRLAANRYQNNMSDDRTNFSQVNLNLASTAASNSFSMTGAPSSSKAVLSALRALQDKIKRLETEKTQALDETKQLRLQIQNQEIEFDHTKQKEKLILQKNLHEVKLSYDSVLSEKNELELRAAKLDERNKDLRLQSENLYDQIQHSENEKQQLEYQYKDLEAQYLQLQMQLDKARQREQELANSLTKESRTREDDRMNLVMKLERVNEQLNVALQDKSLHDKRLAELDELRRGLNSTGQASKRDIEKAVKKQTNKAILGRGLLMKGNGRRRKSGGGGPGLSSPNGNAIATGLKISFKPAELVQTTDKLVMQQIRGALAKSTVTSPSPKKPRARPFKKA